MSYVCKLNIVIKNHLYRSAVATRTVILPFVPAPGVVITGYAADTSKIGESAFEVRRLVWVGKEDRLEGGFEVYLRGTFNESIADPAAFATSALGPKWYVESDSVAG